MIDNDIMREHRDRIELHKQKYLDGNYNKPSESQEDGSLLFRTIICMFIFASLLVLKLTDSSITKNFTTSVSSSLSNDNLPYIINLVENANNYDFGLNKLKTETDALEVDAQNLKNEVENIMEPTTEFTIDENMLKDINDGELVGKK